MNTDFDMEKFRMGKDPFCSVPKTKRATSGNWTFKPAPGEHFLKGPIPRAWLKSAASLAGKALHVGIELWFYAGLKRSKVVALNQSRMIESGVSRDSARRGLRELEKARLVTVARHAGRKPVVTIQIKSLGKKAKRPPAKMGGCNV